MRGFGKPLYLTAWRYGKDRRGAAAAEFALVLTLLVFPVLSAADLALYAWDRMQLDNAAEMAAQAVWATCDSGAKLPALANCASLGANAGTAAQSTGLGADVTVGIITEDNLCPNVGGTALVSAGGADDCSGVNGSTDKPGDYVTIPVSYTYTPLFPGMSIVSLLSATMQSSAQMRLQ